MALLIPPAVFKQLAQLAAMPRDDVRRLLARLERIAEAPEERHPSVVALAGAAGSYRVRQGD